MSPSYPVLHDRPIDQWKVTELKEELKRRSLTTKGLKEELVKRLSKALLSEFDANEDADNESDSVPKSDLQLEEDKRNSEIIDDYFVSSQPEAGFEGGKSESLISRTAEAAMESGTNAIQMVDSNSRKGDESNFESVVDGKDAKENVAVSVSTGDKKQAEIFIQEPVVVKEEIAVAVSVSHLDMNHVNSHEERTHLRPELGSESLLETQSEVEKPKCPNADDGDSMLAHPNSLSASSGPDNQVPEGSVAVGIQVKSDVTSTVSNSINEKNEVKDKIISDVRLRVDVKPEMLQLSSNTASLDNMDTDPVDVACKKIPFIEEMDGDIAKTVDFIKNEDSGDSGFPEKLNLDRSSGDDSMEEDALESKPNSASDLLGPKVEHMEPSLGRLENDSVAAVDMPLGTKVSEMDTENGSAAVPSKRKLHGLSAVENNDITKRQRKVQPDARKLAGPQSVNTVPFTKHNDAIHPTVKGGFSKLESADSETPKERVVPPSAKPATNSLRIDRFLRPFTLKAVQDLLGRTGTIVSFWMDNIKTHCFVTYSSVEEAIETRNAVYNLQWPTNGGRLLVAEFVGPQEVKARVEGPLQSPMTPTTPAGLRQNFGSAQPAMPPQPSPKLQAQRQQLPPPPPPLPTNPPAVREKFLPIKKQLPPVKELLPPPPSVPEKVDPPSLTLDDLFSKTKASPRIYYLPLSDEQVATKLNVQGIEGNNMQQ